MNYLKYFKYILLAPLVIGAAFFSFSLLTSLFDEPEILTVQKLNIQNEINKNKTQETNQNITNEPQLITNNFNYKLVGYRAGQNDSSIILKKGSNEFLVKIIQIYYNDNYKEYQPIKEENITELVCF